MPCLFDVPGRPALTYGESGVGMGLEKKRWGAGNCSRDIIYDKRTKKKSLLPFSKLRRCSLQRSHFQNALYVCVKT